jgi:uncharacterized OsmC-like protein
VIPCPRKPTFRARGQPDHGPAESIAVEITLDTDLDADLLERMVRTTERACYVSNLLREDLEMTVSWTRA